MSSVLIDEVRIYVAGNIGTFHKKRLDNLEKLKLKQILKRKNPYLFKAKNILTAQDFVKTILDAHLSSQEETLFGDFLEELAIFINQRTFGGWKSAAEGIDLEFDKDNVRFITAIKSGPNWGNSGQISRMRDNFKKAARVLRTSNSRLHVRAVNGCCYGKEPNPDKGDYQKLCGQDFWSFISGDADLYTELLEPLAYKAKEKNEYFQRQYSIVINKFCLTFLEEFCTDGAIDWDLLVRFNSSAARSGPVNPDPNVT